MTKTAKERMRAYRERLKNDSTRLEEARAKDRERWHERKKLINQVSVSKQIVTRKRWKEASEEYRRRKKTAAPVGPLLPNIPPVCTAPQVENAEDANVENPARGRKRLRKNRAKAYRDNAKVIVKVSDLIRSSDKFRKRDERAEVNLAKVQPETPRRAIKKQVLSAGGNSVKKH